MINGYALRQMCDTQLHFSTHNTHSQNNRSLKITLREASTENTLHFTYKTPINTGAKTKNRNEPIN